MKYFSYIFLICILLLSLLFSSKTIEGFESYENCVQQGYPNSFCMEGPIISKVDYGYCKCADGRFGSFHMDNGTCYCYLYNGLLPHKINTPYQSKPF
jgi:hypothetical protein